ncbi:MAG: sugar ABC transporter substrate-binding protein [Mesorhizobium sp.]|uniref:ABC transporter substrate-binding protein n=1 Tax=Mesorhizobium sp. TaxID=1871066 RepID=UPI00120C5AF0|nr:sugar ABC transporter substrate-binding protein [Mesorhizobium sp.]TIP69624.1 MAG: sugar ABC transporter substrate-binding protein [Mesorhizobium sp.]TIR47532.1 MAG: sugar ABC transporter substrate-binding protein [Mesorhizobium sp.]TJV93366.1 MAG: sugar ABC transporter substrate-binding protein [Mesorhizobium sp.]
MTITGYRLGRRGFLTGMLGASALPLLGSLPARAQNKKLRVFGWGDGANFKGLFDAFEKVSGVKVSFEGVPFPDYQSTLVQRFRTGNSGIDVFFVDPTYVPTFSKAGIVADLTSAFGEKSKGTLFPSDVQGATYNGKMLSMPMFESTQLLFYNKGLLAKAGVEAPGVSPDARMTWDKVIELAKKVQAAGAEWGFGFEQVDRYYQLQVLPESLGGGPGVKGDDLLTVDVANDAWLQAGKWYGSIFADGVAPRGPTEQELFELFKSGRLAFLVGGPWLIAEFNNVDGLDYAAAPHPYFAGGKAVTPSESWHLGVAAGATNADRALKFLSYAGLDKDGAVVATGGSRPSANIDAAAEVLSRIPQQNPNLKGIDILIRYELANTAIRRPRTLGYLQLEELVTRAWSDIRNGSDAAETFPQLQRELERSFKRIKD